MRTARMPGFAGASLRHRVVVSGSIAVLVIASLVVAFGAVPGRIRAAQDAAGQAPSITATGFGEASVPADRAAVQLLVTGFGLVPTPTPTPAPAAAGTPTAVAVEEEEAEPAPLDLVVAAIAGSGNGVAADDVRVTVSPVLSDVFYGQGGTDAARIDLEVPQPRLDLLNTLVARVRDAASGNGLTLGLVGIRYLVDDCASLQRQAEEAAIADARARAQRQAELLGVSLGAVIASTDVVATAGALYFGAANADDCSLLAPGSGYYGPGVGITLPRFDPTAPTEAEVYAQVSLTFAIASAVVATPTAAGVAVTISAPTTTAEEVIDAEPTPTVPIVPTVTPVAVVFAPTHLSNPRFSINLRSAPTPTSEIISVLPPAAPLQFLWEQALDDTRTLWLRFQTEGGSSGWIRQLDAVILP